ncbi:unnamed protein product [Durusdinium trenchii]|uniref:sn-1-specific diacylglycerol lipase n=1 Tax=Durusdinium trenchii TaxID=1381693 RepID=A0ABP0PYA9_9DINO
MLNRSTPSKSTRDFLGTPARAERVRRASGSSPFVASPELLTWNEDLHGTPPVGVARSFASSPAEVGILHASPEEFCSGVLCPKTPEATWGFTPCRSSRSSLGGTSGGGATPSKLTASTPSRIINIRTPLRPCSKQRSKEFQDDVRCALEEQSAELLRVALQRRHPCPMDHALHEAVRQGNCDAARLLLENSAEPNDRCLALDHGEFPLQLALSSNLVSASDRHQMVELLLDARADVGQRRNDAEGHTPLHDGVRRGDPGVVALLLRHQADPNATNAFGEAPLELAARGSFYTDVRDSFSLVEAWLAEQLSACKLFSFNGARALCCQALRGHSHAPAEALQPPSFGDPGVLGVRQVLGVCRLQREAVLPPVRPAISVAGFMVLGLAAGALWRRRKVSSRQFLERLKLPLQPSLQQVIGVLQRVDPALGNLAETVSQVWGLLQSELAEQLTEDASGARSGRLLLHLFALGRLKSLQSAGFDLPVEQVPLVSDLPQLTEAYRLTKLAVASYGANVLALVGLLQFKDAWPSAGPDRDRVAAARYLEVPVERMLAYGTLGDSRKESEEPKSALERFKPWWILMEDGDELILSIRGSANIDDIATDLACATCEFLHGYAHEGVAGAVSAVWDEAESEVAKAIQARDYQRLVVCGHSLGGAVSLLLGMKLRATNALPLEVHAFAAGPPPAFQGESRPELEEGLISVINRFDPVPHLSLDAALRMVLAAEKLADEGLSWQQTLGLVVGTNEFASPKFDDLIAKIPKQAKAPLRIPGEAIWLVDACAGRQVLAVDLRGRLQDFVEELPEISVAQSALDHVMSTYVYNMEKALKRVT